MKEKFENEFLVRANSIIKIELRSGKTDAEIESAILERLENLTENACKDVD
tara:strand:- start:717 stop:869 length:153 start_codon:yes stop_codon:yes gene_type:complete